MALYLACVLGGSGQAQGSFAAMPGGLAVLVQPPHASNEPALL